MKWPFVVEFKSDGTGIGPGKSKKSSQAKNRAKFTRISHDEQNSRILTYFWAPRKRQETNQMMYSNSLLLENFTKALCNRYYID